MGLNKAGLEKVAHADTPGGAQTDIAGKISTESSVTPANTKTEHTLGSVFGGGSLAAEIYFLDDAGFSATEALMTANTEKYWFFHYKDGRVLRTADPVNPFARPGTGENARDGAVAWILDFEQFSDVPMIVIV